MPGTFCNICYNALSPAKTVSCRPCSKGFHPTCTELKSLTNFNKMKQENKPWTCSDCQSKNLTVRKKNDISNISSNTDSYSNLVSSINNIKSTLDDIICKLNMLTKSNSELEKSVNYCSDKVDSFDSTLNKLSNSISEQGNRISKTESRCLNLELEMEKLHSNINFLEQDKLVNNIEITGIPMTDNENTFEIIKIISNKLNIELDDKKVIKAYRMTLNKNKMNCPSIIVNFDNTSTKLELIKAIKLRAINQNGLLANEIHTSFAKNNVYINDQLTKDNKHLFWLARLVSKNYNYRFSWANHSGVFIKRDEGSRFIKIISINQLKKLDTEKSVTQLW